MKLSKLQRLFSKLINEHINWLHEQGWETTDGDAYRDPRSHGKIGEKLIGADGKKVYGRRNSNHKRRLSRDINLCKDDEFLTRTVDHKISGQKWELRHPLCRWGGRYDDGNHYSMEYKGFQ